VFTPGGNARITAFIECVHARQGAMVYKGGPMKHKSILSLGVFLIASWRFTARTKGEMRYICRLHPVMKGVLVVK